VILIAVYWYLRYALSYRDVEELLAERGITVDHVTVYRWVQRFTPLSSTRLDPAGTLQAIAGSSTKPTSRSPGRWVYLYRAIDQCGQVIGVLVSEKRDLGPPADSSPAPSSTAPARLR
jgi:transposase-like protein